MDARVATPCELSVVIPVHNEVAILARSVHALVCGLRELGIACEVVLAENGSTDDTVACARELTVRLPEVTTFSYPHPNYGGALREGIYRARGRFVVCEEIDLCDVDFLRRAYAILRNAEAEFVVGSKTMRGARDRRPLPRRVATLAYNRLLCATLGYRGTDTHGLKAFARDTVLPTVAACVVEHDVFASELVIRAQRAGVRVVEIPVQLREKRAPSVRLAARVPRVLKNLMRLMVSLGMQRSERQVPRSFQSMRDEQA